MKKIINTFSVIAVVAFTFSCSPEENAEQFSNEEKSIYGNPYLGDVDQTPQRAYIRADLVTDRTSPAVSCGVRSRVFDYTQHRIQVIRGALSSNATLNPEVNVTVQLSGANGLIAPIVVTIPANELIGYADTSDIIDESIAPYNTLGDFIQLDVIAIWNPNVNVNVSQYYGVQNSGFLGCK